MRVLAAALLLAGALPAAAEPEGAAFLRLPVGARAVAMGGAFSAVADDASAIAWNPAGLAQLHRKELAFSHTELFGGAGLDFAGFALPLGSRGATLGFGVLRLGQATLEGRDAAGNATGGFEAADLSASAAFALRDAAGRRFGASLKYLRSSISGYAAQGAALDAGAVFPTPVRRLRLSASVRNLGPGLKFLDESQPLPLTLGAGAAWNPAPELTLTADLGYRPRASESEFGFGMEFAPIRSIRLRGGYSQAVSQAVSRGRLEGVAGASVGLGLALGSTRLDYAFIPHGELGSSQRATFLVRF